MTRTGGCACGAIRFEISAPPLMAGACHCTDCQQLSGGGASYVAMFPRDAVTLTKGTPAHYAVIAESGTKVSRAYCRDCGTPLWSDNPNMPVRPVKLGALDDASDITPTMHIFTRSAPTWHTIPADAPRFDTMPPMRPGE